MAVRSFEVKAGLMLALLFMILMRLVWMDLRSYTISYAPENRRLAVDVCLKGKGANKVVTLGRPGWMDSLPYRQMLHMSCRGSTFSESSFVRYNQGLLLFTVVCCMLMTRIVTRSWLIGLFVGMALLSRGRLITLNGEISGDHLIMAGLAAWCLTIAHWLRSGSRLVLGMQFIAVFWLILLEFSFAWLLIAVFLFLVFASSRSFPNPFHIEESDYESPWTKIQSFFRLEKPSLLRMKSLVGEGGLFRPIYGSMELYLRDPEHRRRVQREWAIGSAAVMVCAFISLLFREAPMELHPSFLSWSAQKAWLRLWILELDRDLLLSIIMLLFCLRHVSYWLPGLNGLAILCVLGFGFTTLGLWTLDHLSPMGGWLAADQFLWWEPIFLTFGILGSYHLLISAFTRIGRFARLSRS
jgi:hypothetical protein